MNYTDFETIDKTYGVIYADPPWEYDNKKTGGNHVSGASQHYQTMSDKELLDLPVLNIAKDDSVLFLWSTVPLMPLAFELMEKWGFEYKTKLTWDKELTGMGYWFRGRTEDLLIGKRGGVRAFRSQLPNLIRIPRRKHSKKPNKFREIIEGVTYGLEPKIELFARCTPHGWDTWGNDPNLEQSTLDANLDNFSGATS